MSLAPQKIDKLRALLSGLPGDMAARLCRAAGQGDPSLGRLLDYCRTDADSAARARFFAPLEPVSGRPGDDRPSRCWAPEGLQAKVWAWLSEDLAPDLIEQVRAASALHAADPAEGALDAYRRDAAGLIEKTIKSLAEEPKRDKRLKARLGVTEYDAVLRIASLLRSAPVLRDALAGLPDPIVDLTEKLSATIRDRYDAAVEADPDAAVWALFVIMARLDRPWRMLRVFERISHREDDLLVSQTDMSHIGEALLADAEHHLAGFAAAPATLAEAADAAQALADFSAVTVGMTREIGIRKDGAWGKRLYELRGRASAQMEQIFEIARDVLGRATPEAGGLKGRTGARDGENLPERARALARFLLLSRDDAGRAAVGGAHGRLVEEVGERLETAGAKTLEKLKSGEGDAAKAFARLEEIAALMEALGEHEAGQVLLRRSAAALAA
ncbi:MAG: hypothetical protein ABL308_15135 [Oceanicaulis sp.]